MGDWLYDLPLGWMALIIFAATYGVAAAIYWIVTRLAVDERARAFKALSPGMLPPLGIIFGLLVGFIAVQVWSDFDRAKVAVVHEASALRSAVLLAANFSPSEAAELRTVIGRHIETCVEEWPAMAEHHATLALPPPPLVEALQRVLAYAPTNDGQRTAQREIASSLQTALDARRQRVVISQSSVSAVKWAGLLLQALITLIAIAMVHSDNRLTCAIALTLFATGVALSVTLIASHNRPFTGTNSVGPKLLQQVLPNEPS
jgi:positive regulator of sigma E activity